MTQRSKSAILIRLMDVWIKPADGDWMQLARNAPAAFDEPLSFVELGQSIREAFGGGVQAAEGAELQLRFRWVRAPEEEDE